MGQREVRRGDCRGEAVIDVVRQFDCLRVGAERDNRRDGTEDLLFGKPTVVINVVEGRLFDEPATVESRGGFTTGNECCIRLRTDVDVLTLSNCCLGCEWADYRPVDYRIANGPLGGSLLKQGHEFVVDVFVDEYPRECVT